MEEPKTYCEAVAGLDKNNVHKRYHDLKYGFPIKDDNELFARLVLEINQAGLSWTTILKKEENFYKAFKNFDIKKVAKFGDKDRKRLLSDAGIIRNRLKIDAAIHQIDGAPSIEPLSVNFLLIIPVLLSYNLIQNLSHKSFEIFDKKYRHH